MQKECNLRPTIAMEPSSASSDVATRPANGSATTSRLSHFVTEISSLFLERRSRCGR